MSISLNNGYRGLIKSGCAAGMYWTGMDRLIGACRGQREAPLVVGYHRVVDDFEKSAPRSIPSLLTSLRTFEQQLDWIGERYDFVSLDELALIVEGARPRSKAVAAVTFDDGYRDVYVNAFPILKRKGIPAAVFVVSDLVGTDQLLPHDELYLLLSAVLAEKARPTDECWRTIVTDSGVAGEQAKRLYARIQHIDDPFGGTRAILESLNQSGIRKVLRALRRWVSLPPDSVRELQTLDWDMLREMASGGVTVGSHTKSHALLANESDAVVREEVVGSRQVLERGLGMAVVHFAYPDGSFDARSIAALAGAGYRTAHTICRHQDRDHPQLTIPRRMFWQNTCLDGFGRFSPAILSCQTNGLFDPAARCRRGHRDEARARAP